jgi:zinc transporter 12
MNGENQQHSENGTIELHALEEAADTAAPPAVEVRSTVVFGLTTLALIIILGDGLHNIGDGLAIGAAFSASTTTGMSTALAVLFHEIPHELGDFAILLMTGMTIKRALLWNFISSLTAFVGLYIGLAVGSESGASTWILTVTVGMFLYVAVGDMMPELKNYQTDNRVYSLIAQNVGALTGMIFMCVFFIYEDDIKW